MGARTTGDIVAQYVAAGAPCISVVTGRWFGGDDELFRDAVELTDLPLLKKDFITRERQILEAKHMGASAILLTARILPKSSFQRLIETILAHELTPFVEVADRDELESVIHAEDCIIAINNKDIRNQERDGGEIEVSRSLLQATLATAPLPGQRERDPRPPRCRRADRRRLPGTADRHRTAAGRQCAGLGRRIQRHRNADDQRTVPPTDRRGRPLSGVERHDHRFTSRSLRRAGQPRTRRAGAHLAGQPITRGELADLVARAGAELARLDLPPDRPVGIQRRSPPGDRADARLPERPAPVHAPVRRARARDTRAALRAGGREPRCSRPRSTPATAPRSPPALSSARPTPQWPPAGSEPPTCRSCSRPRARPDCRRSCRSPRSGIDEFTAWAAAQFDIGPGTTVLNYAPLNFDLCLLDIWTTLKYGGTVVLVDQDRGTNGGYLAGLIADHEVNVVQAVPMLYRLLIDVAREEAGAFASVRHALTTGDKMPASSLKELPGLFPNARFFNVYGCTETNDSLIAELDLSGGDVPANLPVGQPLPGVTALIEDGGGGFLEGEGTGELLVWTPFQTHGLSRRRAQRGQVRRLSGRWTRREALFPYRRHRAPPRGRLAHPRGPQRLLRQGARRARQHAGRRAGDPGAP